MDEFIQLQYTDKKQWLVGYKDENGNFCSIFKSKTKHVAEIKADELDSMISAWCDWRIDYERQTS